jgi:hypothetical protein
MNANTFNICLTHVDVPSFLYDKADVVITSSSSMAREKSIFIDKNEFGVNGVTLSEYAQLFALRSFLINKIIPNEYIRIFHYRRFVSIGTLALARSKNLYWSYPIRDSDCCLFEEDFVGMSSQEIFNTPIEFPDSLLNNYQREHFLGDLLLFSEFLVGRGILSALDVANFLTLKFMIPACSIGVYRASTLIEMLNLLFLAADFRNHKNFVRREGYQERNMGFLLERLQSFLILKYISVASPVHVFGKNIVISDSIVQGTVLA